MFYEQIVLDVHEFIEGDVKVNLIDEQQLVVEGRVQKKEGNSSSSNTFRRIFALPGDTDMTAIMPVISADGILTITAPKMVGLCCLPSFFFNGHREFYMLKGIHVHM